MGVSELQAAAHPQNYRDHPARQRELLAGVLGDVGLVRGVMYNRRTGHVVDGHLRVTLALERGESELPVTVVDLDESEEMTVLATLDPIGAMARNSAERYHEVIDAVSESSPSRQIEEHIQRTRDRVDTGPPIVSSAAQPRLFSFSVDQELAVVVDAAFAAVGAELDVDDPSAILVEICKRVTT